MIQLLRGWDHILIDVVVPHDSHALYSVESHLEVDEEIVEVLPMLQVLFR